MTGDPWSVNFVRETYSMPRGVHASCARSVSVDASRVLTRSLTRIADLSSVDIEVAEVHGDCLRGEPHCEFWRYGWSSSPWNDSNQ
jgi:hypothetical protein